MALKRSRETRWTALLVGLSLPGVTALLTYLGSWIVSKVLFEWLRLHLTHVFVLLALFLAAAIAPFTSLLGALLIGVLGPSGRVTGRNLLLVTLLTVLSTLGALLMGLWWNGTIPMPGVGAR